jgi:hypothetical protein
MHLSSILLPNCLKRSMEPPSDFLLGEESAKFVDPNYLLWRMSGVVIRLCTLIAASKNVLICEMKPREKVQELGLELTEIFEALKAKDLYADGAETPTASQYSSLSRNSTPSSYAHDLMDFSSDSHELALVVCKQRKRRIGSKSAALVPYMFKTLVPTHLSPSRCN